MADATLNIKVTVSGKENVDDLNKSVKGTSLTWSEFVGQRMGPYMKELGSHGEAIKKIAAEWKSYKAGLDVATPSVTTAGVVTKTLSANLGELRQKIKILDFDLAQGKINAVDFSEGLTRVRQQALALTNERTKLINVETAIANAEMRVSTGSRGVASDLAHIRTATMSVQPAMISLTQVIQDMPYGIRGIGNNVEFLMQQFTSLRTSGMSTATILSSMLKTMTGPLGILFAVSIVTSLATAFGDKLFPSVKKTNDVLDEQIEKWERLQKLRFEIGELPPEKRREQLEAMVNQTQAELEKARKGTVELKYSRFEGTERIVTLADPKVLQDLETKVAQAKKDLLDFDKKEENEEEKIYEVVNKRLGALKNMLDVGDITKNQYVEQLRLILQQEISSEQSYQIRKEILDINKETQEHAEKALPYVNKLERDRFDMAKLQYETHKLSLEAFIREAETAKALTTDAKQKLQIEKEIQETRAKDFKSKFQKVDLKQEGEFGKETTWQARIKQSDQLTLKQKVFVDATMTGVDAIANNISQNIGAAWERAFGRANSLLEIFAQAFSQMILSLAAKAAVLFALDLLSGGTTSFLDKFFGTIVGKASGGWIPEPVFGIGKSGQRYAFGERGPEYVVPYSQANDIAQSARYGSSSMAMTPSIHVIPIIDNKGLAVQVEIGNRVNKGMRR